MPICINLLAEAKAAEEQRRNDPVKRAIFIAGCLVFLFALWACSLQFKLIASKSELNRLEARWKEIDKNFQSTLESQKRTTDVQSKLIALQQLNSNRFLWGTALNAVQQTLDGVQELHVTRIKTEQSYAQTDEVKGRKDGERFVAGKPATAVEKIVITLDAIDASPKPGGANVSKFKETIATSAFFQSNLQKTNGVLLTGLSAPSAGPSGRPQVNLTLQCFFPEKARQ
jgi:hypothetical protein